MNVQKVFDALLVLQYRSGDKRAMGLLVKRYHAKLCRHAYWYTSDVEEAQDIVQDSWGVIIQKLGTLKNPNTFGSWAMKIVSRKSLDFLKQKKAKLQRLREFRPHVLNADQEEGKGVQIMKLKRAIAELPENQRQVLQLFYTEDYSLNEISEILDVSIGTIKSRLFHAREKLKLILNQ